MEIEELREFLAKEYDKACAACRETEMVCHRAQMAYIEAGKACSRADKAHVESLKIRLEIEKAYQAFKEQK